MCQRSQEGGGQASPQDVAQMTFAELRDALLERGALDRAWVQRINQAEADFWRRNSGFAGFPRPLAPPASVSAWKEHRLTPTTHFGSLLLSKKCSSTAGSSPTCYAFTILPLLLHRGNLCTAQLRCTGSLHSSKHSCSVKSGPQTISRETIDA